MRPDGASYSSFRYRGADGLTTEPFEKMLRAYREAGGRVLFIGGHPAPAIEPLGKHLERTRDPFYPLPAADMPGSKLALLDANNRPIGEPLEIAQVMKDFDTRAFGAYSLKADAPEIVRPVMSLQKGDTRVTVGSGLVKDGRFEVIHAPWYLFVPGALSNERRVRDLDRPVLSREGTRVLDHLLAALKPKP